DRGRRSAAAAAEGVARMPFEDAPHIPDPGPPPGDGSRPWITGADNNPTRYTGKRLPLDKHPEMRDWMHARLAKHPPDEFEARLPACVVARNPAALKIYLERCDGRVPLPVEPDQQLTYTLVFETIGGDGQRTVQEFHPPDQTVEGEVVRELPPAPT